jgi:hypothetical protein
MSLEMAERVLVALAHEPALESVHLAGGEATLNSELLLAVVQMAIKHDVRLSYLETNAAWCADLDETFRRLTRLKEAGLPGLLVSASMFHLEFVPFAYTRNCVDAACQVFGRHNVLIWLPHMYAALDQMPDHHRTWRLSEFCDHFGLARYDERLPGLYQTIAAGRAPEALRECYTSYPAERFASERCGHDLCSTTHFHIDLYGNLITGFCAGIASGSIDDLHPEITPDRSPIVHTLCEEGPFGLSELAKHEHGFVHRHEGYVSKCDLCYDVRRQLHTTARFSELRPVDYYECR